MRPSRSRPSASSAGPGARPAARRRRRPPSPLRSSPPLSRRERQRCAESLIVCVSVSVRRVRCSGRWSVPDAAIRAGLSAAWLPGRFEVLWEGSADTADAAAIVPDSGRGGKASASASAGGGVRGARGVVVLDGAHTPASAAALAATLRQARPSARLPSAPSTPPPACCPARPPAPLSPARRQVFPDAPVALVVAMARDKDARGFFRGIAAARPAAVVTAEAEVAGGAARVMPAGAWGAAQFPAWVLRLTWGCCRSKPPAHPPACAPRRGARGGVPGGGAGGGGRVVRGRGHRGGRGGGAAAGRAGGGCVRDGVAVRGRGGAQGRRRAGWAGAPDSAAVIITLADADALLAASRDQCRESSILRPAAAARPIRPRTAFSCLQKPLLLAWRGGWRTRPQVSAGLDQE